MKSNTAIDGFTLLELMITILIGTIITLATTTILLLGLRLNNESNLTVEKQNTTRILLTTLEDLATEGMIKEIIQSGEGNESWEILGHNNENVIFTYDSDNKIIYTGSKGTGVPLLEGVLASKVSLSDAKVLTFSLEMEEGTYTSSMYCRTAPPISNEEKESIFEEIEEKTIVIGDDGRNTSEARKAFLKVLASQYGSNGIIIDPSSTNLTYYSQWYIGTHNWAEGDNAETWNANTPWCACFLSWALDQMKTKGNIINVPHESHVSKYYEYFAGVTNDSYIWKTNNPIPGDIIFFDWDPEETNGYDHVGAVLKVDTDNDIIYTIEGNTANMVAVRSYKTTDPDIVGYGVLDWKTNP